jgi:hypothetical protein
MCLISPPFSFPIGTFHWYAHSRAETAFQSFQKTETAKKERILPALVFFGKRALCLLATKLKATFSADYSSKQQTDNAVEGKGTIQAEFQKWQQLHKSLIRPKTLNISFEQSSQRLCPGPMSLRMNTDILTVAASFE